MNRAWRQHGPWAPLVMAGLMAAGCSDPLGPAPAAKKPAPATAATAAQNENDETVRMGKVNLFIHDNHPTAPGVDRKPLFHLEAERYTMDGPVWVVDKAHATIYAQKEGGSDLALDAAHGRFEEGKGAYLKDGVRAYMNEMTFDMQDVRCDIVEDHSLGSASSDKPVKISGEDVRVEAGSIRLDPNAREIEMTEVRGDFIRFGRKQNP